APIPSLNVIICPAIRVVRGWEEGMAEFFTGAGATVREVVALDLEEGFVELLRSARPEVWTEWSTAPAVGLEETPAGTGPATREEG
ncbi:hypothetical protein ACFL0I_04025, partial [Gemmatimonadota bacterium]